VDWRCTRLRSSMVHPPDTATRRLADATDPPICVVQSPYRLEFIAQSHPGAGTTRSREAKSSEFVRSATRKVAIPSSRHRARRLSAKAGGAHCRRKLDEVRHVAERAGTAAVPRHILKSIRPRGAESAQLPQRVPTVAGSVLPRGALATDDEEDDLRSRR
jgi:hypothetical protein